MKLSETRLGPILAAVSERAATRRAAGNLERLLNTAEAHSGEGEKFCAALSQSRLAIIAEHKRAAPSAGQLAACDAAALEHDVEQRCLAYAEGGAAALSILTEEDHFQGRLEDLQRAAVAQLPRLRKDFILNEWMVRESAAAGADAILLLAVCLEGSALGDLCALAQELGLAVLCEVHDDEELERAVAVNPDCIGVNSRDLRSFEIDLNTTLRLLPQVPEQFVRVAESGIHDFDHLIAVQNAGANAALIGTALMRDADRLARWTKRLLEDSSNA